MGYCGVSPKTCKGLYKSILNRARCLQWNPAEGLPDWGAMRVMPAPDWSPADAPAT